MSAADLRGQHDPGVFLTADELAAVLKIKKGTVRAWQLQGIPFVPVGKLRRYILADVLAWLRERHQLRHGKPGTDTENLKAAA